MATSQLAPPTQSTGRGLFWSGLALAVLGIVAYMAQFSMQHLTTPWYMPALSTVGALLLLLAVLRRRSIWRILGLLLVVLLAGAQWAFLFAMGLPAYHGPVTVGKPFPAFETLQADGTKFTQAELGGTKNDVLVFFRGRW
jgi:hypothetical protein